MSRGKREDTGKWVEGYYVELPEDQHGKKLCLIIGLDGQYNRIIPETAGGCTGLTDKKNKLMFEGDIVKSIWQHLGDTDTVTGIVKYDNATFFLETNYHYFYFEDNIFSIQCEVIGNIHDPKLIDDIDKPVVENIAQPVLKPATEPPENFQLINA